MEQKNLENWKKYLKGGNGKEFCKVIRNGQKLSELFRKSIRSWKVTKAFFTCFETRKPRTSARMHNLGASRSVLL